MSQVIIQFENKLHKDEPLRKPIEELKEALIKKGKKKYFIMIARPPTGKPEGESAGRAPESSF